MNKKIVSVMLVVGFITCAAFAQEEKEIPKTDKTIPQTALTPSPGEVLNSLSKIGRVQWSSLVTYNNFYNYKGRYKQALNLGVRVADAFVALHDKDKTNFGNMNTVIFSLSQELGISNLIEEQKDKLQVLSQKDDWILLVIELNTMNAELEEELIKQKDDDIVLLSNTGAFFEGIRIVSTHFTNNYDADKIGILNQQQLIHHYMEEIDSRKKMKNNELVRMAYAGLKEMKNLIENDPDISKDTVEQILSVAKNVVNSITE